MNNKPLKPPFTQETAKQKVQRAEVLWNTRNPALVAAAYTENCQWRNRDEFFAGRDQIIEFLTRKWQRELDYQLRKQLWCYSDNRIAVTFQYEWHDRADQWFRSYGNELWDFAENGLMQKRLASINDVKISESEREIT
jgi:nuclear transport factor 2 (NTF2) superfamily protein